MKAQWNRMRKWEEREREKKMTKKAMKTKPSTADSRREIKRMNTYEKWNWKNIVVCLLGNVYGLKNCNCNAANSNFHNMKYGFGAQVAQQLYNMNLIKINPFDIYNQLNETKSEKKKKKERKWIKIKWKT